MRIAVARRNEMMDALLNELASGKFRVYSGTRPTDADTALSGNTLLAELTLNSTFAPSSSGGTLTANAITQDSSADATGTASVTTHGAPTVPDRSLGQPKCAR